jgi:hypothetical protein
LFLSTPDVAITAAASLDPGSKFYQLEEMEDKDACTTELFLLNDGSIQVSETNGPPPAKSSGQWRLESNNDGGGVFEMTIVRTYGTGNQNTDLGEFTFNVERNFIGNVSIVGGLVSVTGAISMKVREEEIYHIQSIIYHDQILITIYNCSLVLSE